MANEIFSAGFLDHFKILIVGILIYALIYAMLKKIDLFGNNKAIDSLIALLAAVIVSFTGVMSYVVSYAINWFIMIIFILFLMIVTLMFLGIKFTDISTAASKNGKLIFIVFMVLFSIILLKGFFAINNSFDINNPQNDPYEVNTEYNTGMDDIVGENNSFFSDLFSWIDKDILAAVLFLAAIGIFVILIG